MPNGKYEKLATWLASYRSINASDKRLLQLMSVFYTPVSARDLCDAATRAQAFRPPKEHAKVLVSFLKRLKALLKDEFVIKVGDLYALPPMSLEALARDAVDQEVFGLLAEAMKHTTNRAKVAIPTRYKQYKSLKRLQCSDYTEGLRLARVAFYSGEKRQFDSWLQHLKREYPSAFTHLHPLAAIFGKTHDLTWFSTLPQVYIWDGLYHGFAAAQWNLRAGHQTEYLAKGYCDKHNDELASSLQHELAYHLFLQGNWDEALSHTPEQEPHALRGMRALLQGNAKEAIAQIEGDLTAFRTLTGDMYAFYDGFSGIFLILALLSEGTPASTEKASHYLQLAISRKHPLFAPVHRALQQFLQHHQQQLDPTQWVTQQLEELEEPDLGALVSWWIAYWLAPDQLIGMQAQLRLMEAAYQRAHEAGYEWLAAELAQLLDACDWAPKKAIAHLRQFTQTHHSQGLLKLFQSKDTWEYSLEALLALKPNASREAAKRIVWRIESKGPAQSPRLQLHPYMQKRNNKGNWTKGRKLELQAFAEEVHAERPPAYLTPADNAICQHLKREQKRAWAGWGKYDWEQDQAILALAGHPRVYWHDAPQQPVTIFMDEPRLRVLKEDDNASEIKIVLEPSLTRDVYEDSHRHVTYRKEGESRLALIPLTPSLRQLASIVRRGIRTPADASKRVMQAIFAVAPLIRIQSALDPEREGIQPEDVVTKAPDARIIVRLSPAGQGLRVRFVVRPFGHFGPRLSPGGGGAVLYEHITARGEQTPCTYQVKRDLALEMKRREALLEQCPTLQTTEATDGAWHLTEPADCIELLSILEEQGDAICIEWPEGQHLRIKAHVNGEQFRASIKQEQDWFSLEGELQVDPTLVLSLRQLLQMTANHPGRFIQLEEGDFLALSEQFRMRLETLTHTTESTAEARRFHNSTGYALQDVLNGFGDIQEQPTWQRYKQRFEETPDFEVPDTFHGTLREYQREGFLWLSRLAHWGLGACLADQMGLGKTLQSLALLLTRATKGPALVVAPTSVCANWFDEAERFAPSLQLHELGQSDDRDATVAALGEGDIALCSYGLLPFVQDILHSREWATVILDEAQAIKNPSTQRARVVFGLQAESRVVTTGTPIENHLGDLWSLFRFLNPGLFGSWEQFQHKFAVPIEREQDPEAKEQLKRLVQPFILRRHKQDVLKELPPRTEISLRVTPGSEEAAFYEALRQEALAHIDAQQLQGGQLHMHILRELTRLRMACCHPTLIAPESELQSAKHEAFTTLVEGLLEEGHKILVFSQFVKHLKLLEESLQARDISYQYLDGSTSTKARKKRIAAFQKGEGDVFLISLKAGGSGINLTAADYVIHTDPWWNPAVEDQASDRAHRIGQTRPVTVYRLIMEGSIEEKIVDLHQHKRDLAESLLDGSEMTGKMTAEELISLLQST